MQRSAARGAPASRVLPCAITPDRLPKGRVRERQGSGMMGLHGRGITRRPWPTTGDQRKCKGGSA